MARAGSLVGIAPTRPSGYPLILRFASLDGHSLVAAVLLQHLSGLVVGVLVYALLRRLELARWLSLAGAAIVLFDAYAVALEQHILSEAFFTLALTASLFGLVACGRRPRVLVASGLLLALATTMRPIAIFAVPLWLVFMVLGRPGRRPALAAAAAAVLPLFAYGALHGAVTGTFGLTQADGWFLYGRVGEIVRCDHIAVSAAERGLCVSGGGRGPSYFIFGRHSPARRALGGISADKQRQAYTNDLLRGFSLKIIRARPGAYAGLVARDFARFFEPGVSSGRQEDATVTFPRRVKLSRADRRESRGLPTSYRPHAAAPAGALASYGRLVHTPRWLMAILAAIALVASVLRMPRRRPVALLVLSALAMLVGGAATAGFALRYLLPAVPLLVCAGLAGGADLVGALRGRVPQTSRLRRLG
ncbi:MAG: hypothetical protein NVSMB25_23510 [Thermoleophilaceae bacterium]